MLQTHPNKLFAGGKLHVTVLNDGKPLAGALVEFAAASDASGNAAETVEIRSNGQGVVELPLPRVGLHHLMTRHRFGPATLGAAAYSYTVGITLEVVE